MFVSIETTAFSGATLLALLLGNQPKIATIGEISGLIARDDPATYRCSCGELIRTCDFWRAIEAAMARRGFDFSVDRFETKFDLGGPRFAQRLRAGSARSSLVDNFRDRILFAIPSERRKLQALVDRNVALVQSVLEVTGKELFVDSSKNRLRIKALQRLSSLEVRVIHLVRRVEGVVASQMRRGRGADVATLARQWCKRHRRIERELESWPDIRHLLVRYEELCQDTAATVGSVLRFLGVDPSVEETDSSRSPLHVIGNPMRLRPLAEIKLDTRWQRELTGGQLQEIARVAGELNRRYGY